MGAIAVTINSGEAISSGWSFILLLVIFPLVAFIFYCWFWHRSGQTLGMQAWRLKLVANTGDITFTLCLCRFCISILSIAFLGLGLFWMFFDSQKRTWQDIASNSQVYQLA